MGVSTNATGQARAGQGSGHSPSAGRDRDMQYHLFSEFLSLLSVSLHTLAENLDSIRSPPFLRVQHLR